MKNNYIVWVGGVCDHYDNYQEALHHLEDWLEKGYDDVSIEVYYKDAKEG